MSKAQLVFGFEISDLFNHIPEIIHIKAVVFLLRVLASVANRRPMKFFSIPRYPMYLGTS